ARWRLMNALMVASIIGTSVGLWLFAPILRGGGDVWRTTAGASAYAFVGVLWVIALAFRATTTVEAARMVGRGGTIPDWLEPLGAWTGALYTIYMIVAYVSISLFGWAILR